MYAGAKQVVVRNLKHRLQGGGPAPSGEVGVNQNVGFHCKDKRTRVAVLISGTGVFLLLGKRGIESECLVRPSKE